jgi:hypothetical protein
LSISNYRDIRGEQAGKTRLVAVETAFRFVTAGALNASLSACKDIDASRDGISSDSDNDRAIGVCA